MGSAVPIAAPVAAGQVEEITALRILSRPQCPVFPVSGVFSCQAKLLVTVITSDCNLSHDHSPLYPALISLS